jgi:hypothetical protein
MLRTKARANNVRIDVALFMYPVRKLSDNSEVGATASNSPEQIGVLLFRRFDNLSVSCHDSGSHEIIAN